MFHNAMDMYQDFDRICTDMMMTGRADHVDFLFDNEFYRRFGMSAEDFLTKIGEGSIVIAI